MKWRCINDWFGYCSGEPDGASKAMMEDRAVKVNGVDTIVKINLGIGATCSLDPKSCGKRQSFIEVCPPSTAKIPEKQEVSVIPAIVTTPKKIKTKKEKQEMLPL